MTTVLEDDRNEAAETEQDVTIVLNNEILNGLRSRVAFETVGDVHALIADAINTYTHLGQLSASGTQIFARDGEEGEFVRLRFPFDTSAASRQQ